jgi:hypothetical protein
MVLVLLRRFRAVRVWVCVAPGLRVRYSLGYYITPFQGLPVLIALHRTLEITGLVCVNYFHSTTGMSALITYVIYWKITA